MTVIYSDTDIENWELPHMNNRANDAPEVLNRRISDAVNDTTRRYPRSLSEAYGDVRAQWFERPEPSFTRTCGLGHAVAWVASLAGACVVILVLWGTP